MTSSDCTSTRIPVLLFGFMECLFLSGVIYGWPTFVYIMKQDGIYSHLCENDTQWQNVPDKNLTDDILRQVYLTCPQQDERFNLIFTIAYFCFLGSSVIIGAILDKYGLRIARTISGGIYIAGCLCLGFASINLPWLLFPGSICIGIGGLPIQLTNLQVGNYFRKLRLVVVTVYCAAFDTSAAITPLLVKTLYEQANIGRTFSFCVLGGLALVLMSVSTSLMPKFKIPPRDETLAVKSADNYVVCEEKTTSDTVFTTENYKSGAKMEPEDNKSGTACEPVLNHVPLRKCVLNLTFLLAVLWHGLIQLRLAMYIGGLNVWLEVVTENNLGEISYFTDVFSYMLLSALVIGPLGGFILTMEQRRLKKDEMSYWRKIRVAAIPEFMCTVFATILSISALFQIKELLYVQFSALALMRSFLYGLTHAFIIHAFPSEHFGTLCGVLYIVTGLMSLIQYPLFMWAEQKPENAFYMNSLLLGCVVLAFVQPLYLRLAEHFKEPKKKDGSSENI